MSFVCGLARFEFHRLLEAGEVSASGTLASFIRGFLPGRAWCPDAEFRATPLCLRCYLIVQNQVISFSKAHLLSLPSMHYARIRSSRAKAGQPVHCRGSGFGDGKWLLSSLLPGVTGHNVISPAWEAHHGHMLSMRPRRAGSASSLSSLKWPKRTPRPAAHPSAGQQGEAVPTAVPRRALAGRALGSLELAAQLWELVLLLHHAWGQSWHPRCCRPESTVLPSAWPRESGGIC